jgi:hypothetical protein
MVWQSVWFISCSKNWLNIYYTSQNKIQTVILRNKLNRSSIDVEYFKLIITEIKNFDLNNKSCI